MQGHAEFLSNLPLEHQIMAEEMRSDPLFLAMRDLMMGSIALYVRGMTGETDVTKITEIVADEIFTAFNEGTTEELKGSVGYVRLVDKVVERLEADK